MNQRADRRRAFHRVWQPHMQRQLAGLAHRAHEQQQADDRRDLHSPNHPGWQSLQQAIATVVKRQRAGRLECQQDADEKTHVADARDDERFFAGGGGLRLVEPETDKQIRRDADNFPAHEQQQQAVGQHEAKHPGGEQRQVTEKPRHAFVVFHVAGGVDKNEQADESDHRQHRAVERVEYEAKRDGCVTNSEPRDVERGVDIRCHAPCLVERSQRQSTRAKHRGDGHAGGAAAVLQPASQGGGQQRQQGNEGQCRGAHSSLNVFKDSKSTVLKCR